MVIQNLEEYIGEGSRFAEEVFRKLHSWPEPGREEYRTAALIGKKLKEIELDIKRPLATAVTAEIQGQGKKDQQGKTTVALRADIDALPIQETTAVHYKSRREDYMHACGHDAHTAILLGTAWVLQKMKSVLPCNVRFIFQPDEEGVGGAQMLIREGALEDVNYIYGLHVFPQLHTGTIGLRYGTVHGESRMAVVKVKGKQAHGARPQLGRDAVYASAEYICLCQNIISRYLDPEKGGVITFGTVEGGTAPNVIADDVILKGIIRGEDKETCDLICNRMEEYARGLSQVLDVEIIPEFTEGYPALVNRDNCVRQLKKAIESQDCRIEYLQKPTLTVDDFSYYLHRVPGAYFFLGCGFPDRENSGLHTSNFLMDPDCIAVGIENFVRLCLSIE